MNPKPQVGQRWKYCDSGVIEITLVDDVQSIYQAIIVQSNSNSWPIGWKWEKLPGWTNKSIMTGWYYLKGQDAPI